MVDFETLDEACRKQGIAPFGDKVAEEYRQTFERPTNLQVNVGYKCNLACMHCFLECSPASSECMSRETMKAALRLFRDGGFRVLDITGGSPEMNPNIEWLIDEAAKIGHVIVRSNLAILADPEYSHMIDVYARNNVEIFTSMSCSERPTVDKVRGTGTYDKMVVAFHKLNDRGYGKDGEHILNVLFTSAGDGLAPDQDQLSPIFKETIFGNDGVVFDNLYCSTNVPLGRYGNRLISEGSLESYLKKLADNFNPAGVPNIMCRYQMNVDYDGRIYECDSYHAMGMPPVMEANVRDLTDIAQWRHEIVFSPICYTCAAGAGSGCCGNTTE